MDIDFCLRGPLYSDLNNFNRPERSISSNMKSLLLLICTSLVLGGPIQLDKRQLSQGFLDALSLPPGLKESVEGYGLKQFLSTLEWVLPVDKAVKTEVLQPKIRTTAKRSRVMWGPYNFEASNKVRYSMDLEDFRYANAYKDAKPGPITQGAMEIGLQMDPNGQMGFKRLQGFCQDCVRLLRGC